MTSKTFSMHARFFWLVYFLILKILILHENERRWKKLEYKKAAYFNAVFL